MTHHLLLQTKTDTTDYISLTELLREMGFEISGIMSPGEGGVPDLKLFKSPAVLPGNNCRNNDKPLFLDIESGSAGLEITLCVFLAFELEGEFSIDKVVDGLEFIKLEFDTGYVLKGAFSAGIKITVTSITDPLQIEIDPIITQLYMQADVLGSADVGLFGASLSGNASLQGDFSLVYCSSCNGVYPSDGNEYERAGEDSSFYFSRSVGYDLLGNLNLTAGIPGLSVGAMGQVGIRDDNVFDNISPVITLPEFQYVQDIMKFTPENAVSKCRVMLII